MKEWHCEQCEEEAHDGHICWLTGDIITDMKAPCKHCGSRGDCQLEICKCKKED